LDRSFVAFWHANGQNPLGNGTSSDGSAQTTSFEGSTTLPRVPTSRIVILGVVGLMACATPPPPHSAATAVVSSAVSNPPPARPTPSAALLVLAKRDEKMDIVDPKTLEIVARISVGRDPHEVVASPDGTLAYASNYGGGTFNSLAVVDLVAQQAKPAIDLGALRGPHGLAYVGGKVWFTAEGAKAVGSYDPAKGGVDWVIGTGQDRTHMLDVSPDMTRIITTNVASGTMSFLAKSEHTDDHAGPPPGAASAGSTGGPPPQPPGPPRSRVDWHQTLVQVGRGTEGFDLAPGGHELWAADAEDGRIAVVDVATHEVAHWIDAGLRGANRLKFSLDGKWVFVSSLGGSDLVVFDAASRAEAKRVPLGHGAAGILMQPDGARAYVACSRDNYVAVIDMKSMSVVGRIEAGNEPDGMAWASRP
jgi:YVTN family beta-propeller protein